MGKVYVFNDNTYDFKSTFKGDPIFLKAKSYLLDEKGKKKEMDMFEANEFRGDYYPPKLLGNGEPDPSCYKIIKLEPLDEAQVMAIDSHVCMQCKHKSPSGHELEAHIKFTHADEERLSLPEEDAKPAKRARA